MTYLPDLMSGVKEIVKMNKSKKKVEQKMGGEREREEENPSKLVRNDLGFASRPCHFRPTAMKGVAFSDC